MVGLTVSGAVPVLCNVGKVVTNNRPDDISGRGCVSISLEFLLVWEMDDMEGK